MSETEDRLRFEQIIRELQATAINFAAQMEADAATRSLYERSISAMSADLRQAASSGQISWHRAAEEASLARNAIMDDMRWRSSPIGRARAEALKANGANLNTLVARQTLRRYGSNADFNALSRAQQNRVYLDIVESSGRANQVVTGRLRAVRATTRSLVFLSLAVSTYNIAVADDKVAAAGEEAAYAGAGIAGGVVGGAAAGLVCGPGAPVCVTVGAFAGGVLAAFGVSFLF